LSEDHERIEELLAGYVLLSLSGEDAAEADRILAEHVPSCGRCRATLNELQAVSGDLALAAAPVDPPETLLPRIHRAIDEVPLAGRTPRRGALVAVAASAVALVALGGLSLVLGNRLSDAQTRAGTALEILSAMRSPGAQPVHVTPQDETPPESGMVEVSAPDVRRLYIAAEYCPEPAPGRAYQLWLGNDDGWEPVGEMFWPEDGVVLLELEVDVAPTTRSGSPKSSWGRPVRANTDGPSWFGSLETDTADRTARRPRRTDQICVKPRRVSARPSNAIEAAESTGTKRAVLPDILPATTSRARSATIPTATRTAASPRLNAPVNASP
jgi:hypothetical protein